MNIILFVISEDITNIQITVNVYVSRKLPTESTIPKKNWLNFFFVDLLQLIWGVLMISFIFIPLVKEYFMYNNTC